MNFGNTNQRNMIMIDNALTNPVSQENAKPWNTHDIPFSSQNPREVLDDLETRTAVEIFSSPLLEELSTEPVRTWNRLISQTNWEKGRIICEWRNSLVTAGLPEEAYCDESWIMRIRDASNNIMVSPSHISRLRRVYERFGEVRTQYPSLYWSHFQAALGWDDAEMWLEGAVQNQWSVMQMRSNRWETLGAPDELKPHASDILTTELDEDVNPGNDSDYHIRPEQEINRIDQADKTKEKIKGTKEKDSSDRSFETEPSVSSTGELLSSMKGMTELPADLYEAFEQLKVAVLNHKLGGFKSVDPQRIILFLNTMRQLVISRDVE